MKTLITLLILTTTSICFGQNKHADESNAYSIEIPGWLTVKETGNSNFFGGTMPKVKNIENAIAIVAFQKNDFKSFEDFQHIYITGNQFGDTTLFSTRHTWMGTNEKDFKQIKHGVSTKLFLFFQGKIYHHQFALIETSKSYLLINFTSTPETFDENLPKFDEFLKGLTVN